MKIITKSVLETRAIARKFGQLIRGWQSNNSIVLALIGNLGTGKTTFIQGLAKGLGVKDKILSPTFVLARNYNLKNGGRFYHFDSYRLKNEKDLAKLGFKNILKEKNNIIAIEWADKVKRILPKKHFILKFKHLDKNRREILFRV